MIPSLPSSFRETLRLHARQYVRWLVVGGILLLVNAAAWKILYRPSQARLRQLQNAESLLKLKPRLQSLIHEGREILGGWEKKNPLRPDPDSTFQEMKRLANEGHVRIQESRFVDTPKETGASGLNMSSAARASLTVEATGSYHALGRWLAQLERQAGIQIDRCLIVPSVASDGFSSSLHLEISIFLRKP